MAKICVIRQEGGSRILAITKIIPLDWKVVEMEILKPVKLDTSHESITVKIIRVK